MSSPEGPATTLTDSEARYSENLPRRLHAFADSLVRTLKCESAILDGEIVVKDATGRPIFLTC